MKIDYNSNLKFAGVGILAWPRLGLERWFEKYAVIATSGLPWNSTKPVIYTVPQTTSPIEKTEQLIASATFKKLLQGDLAGYKFMPYKPIPVEDVSLSESLMMNELDHIRTFENKAWLRENHGKELPFAPFMIVEKEQLSLTKDCYDDLQKSFKKFVMQDEQLSGGKGTYIIDGFAAFEQALLKLPRNGKIVISEYVVGAKERSTHGCVTRFGIFAGPVQKQLVRTPLLTNKFGLSSNAFCGGEIGTASLTSNQLQIIDRCVQYLGKQMDDAGYKGIFGVDFLLTKNDVFVLEVNARMTGLTPLLTMTEQLTQGTPFTVLQALELADEPYEITDPVPHSHGKGSMLVVYDQQETTRNVTTVLPAGVYDFRDGKICHVRDDWQLEPDDPLTTFVLHNHHTHGVTVRPGVALYTVLLGRPVMDEEDNFLPETEMLIAALHKSVQYAELYSVTH